MPIPRTLGREKAPRLRAAAKNDERAEAAVLQGAASVKPVRAMSCTCAEWREAACAVRAEGEGYGHD